MKKDIIVITMIALITGALWRWMEIIIYNEVQLRAVDDIVWIVLTISIFINYKLWPFRDNVIPCKQKDSETIIEKEENDEGKSV